MRARPCPLAEGSREGFELARIAEDVDRDDGASPLGYRRIDGMAVSRLRVRGSMSANTGVAPA